MELSLADPTFSSEVNRHWLEAWILRRGVSGQSRLQNRVLLGYGIKV
jgi:hypothetical protein